MRMRRLSGVLSLTTAAALAACGATPAASPTATPTPSRTIPAVTLSPDAVGFVSTVLIERKRNLGASAAAYVRIAPPSASDSDAIQAKLSDGSSIAASYRAATLRTDGSNKGLYESSDLPPLAAGIYVEGLREIAIQPAGRSAAHKHAGFEIVLVLDGTLLVRTQLAAPAIVEKGQGFTYSVSNSPIQLFNIGGTVARTLVYSITADGLPFSTNLDQSP